MALDGNERAELLADLHALVTFLEDHPEIPVGSYDARIGYSASLDSAGDEDGAREIRRIADALGEEVRIHHGHHDTAFTIGRARYEATYIERSRMDAYSEFMKPYHEAIGQVTS